MKRTIEKQLIQWKQREERKPLVLYGTRQVGKTYLLQHFGEQNFTKTHYLNFERNLKLHRLFEEDLDPQFILEQLMFLLDCSIDYTQDLVIFDEIQACPRALTSLKYFCEELPELALATAGSLLGLELGDSAFPVGKVDILRLFPLSFEEFLMALDDERGLKAYRSTSLSSPPSSLAHEHLWGRLKQYLVVGGLPEAVKSFRNHLPQSTYSAMKSVRLKQEQLITAYLADIAKHAGKQNSMHIERVWQGAVRQLGQTTNGEAPKFKFKGVVPGVSHYSRLVNSIDWLLKAGLLHKVSIAHAAYQPLPAYSMDNRFKLFLFDCGILGCLSGLSPQTILDYDYGSYKGFFIENFVLQELIYSGYSQLFSWSEKQAEVEFLIEIDGQIIPVEVKAGRSTQAKSLGVFTKKYHPSKRVILSANPMDRDQKQATLYKLPLYLTGRLQALISGVTEKLDESL